MKPPYLSSTAIMPCLLLLLLTSQALSTTSISTGQIILITLKKRTGALTPLHHAVQDGRELSHRDWQVVD